MKLVEYYVLGSLPIVNVPFLVWLIMYYMRYVAAPHGSWLETWPLIGLTFPAPVLI